MSYLTDLAVFVTENVIAVAPWFFLSIGLGVTVRAMNLADGLSRAIAQRPLAAIAAAVGIGAFAPFCSCTVVPVVAGLLVAGVPLAPVMAFWISSPTMDPEIFTFTVAVLGWPLAMMRLLAALILSAGAGIGVHLLVRSGRFANPLKDELRPSCPEPECAQRDPSGDGVTAVTTRPQKLRIRERVRELDRRRLLIDIGRDSWLLGRWILVAFVLEAVILQSVPQETIAGVFGSGNAWSIPLAALVGVPLYVSNLTALPVVGGLLSQGMAQGAAIAFLMAGPVTTMPAMLAVRPLVTRAVFAYYLAVGIVGSMALGALAQIVLT